MVRARVNQSTDLRLKSALALFWAVVLAAAASGCRGTEPSASPTPTEMAGELIVTQVEPTSSPDSIEPTNAPAPIEPTDSPAPIETDATIAVGAADAAVLHVRALLSGQGSWTFHVTVEHPDTGWDDYADGWDVVLPDGTVVKPDADSPFTRLLLHPHENEQPFVRSQTGIIIPEGVEQVTVRAHDLVDGFGGPEIVVDLTKTSGSGFEVER